MQRSWLVSAGRGQTVRTARFWSRVAAVAVMCAGLWCAEAAAQFVAPGGIIPVVANLPGVNDTFWRSDVSILNVTESDTTVTLYLYPEIRGGTAAFEPMVSDPISLPASGQVTARASAVVHRTVTNRSVMVRRWATADSPMLTWRRGRPWS